ncbi:hypothetical protein DPQ33_09600 [Oceanidesulfovibrio indonesiensis]|uniref:ASCH domain-containing protein n=1 Tax=Oceanidesulfovibrio indonesiensis TaxID=54767 RepID=A0A7M3MEU4_9BACT|nr:hypothetical protein [Oceanidesulfovibrio indonesiensis]TVM17415.1 hypothetical protein DPQ33_09600 [Oceanidesulfovibrio indonesiensis]
MKVLFSIKPEFVAKIEAGTKKYEYRKILFKNTNVSHVVIYATRPIGRIIGEFEVSKILSDDPQKLWARTKTHSGVSYDFYQQYFSGCDLGFALEINNLRIYKKNIDPFKTLPSFTPPQSFCYVKNDSPLQNLH